MVSSSSWVLYCVCFVNLCVIAKCTLTMYTLELKHISCSMVVPRNWCGLQLSRRIKHPSSYNFDLQCWVKSETGSTVMFSAQRLECALHASEHLEDFASIDNDGDRTRPGSCVAPVGRLGSVYLQQGRPGSRASLAGRPLVTVWAVLRDSTLKIPVFIKDDYANLPKNDPEFHHAVEKFLIQTLEVIGRRVASRNAF